MTTDVPAPVGTRLLLAPCCHDTIDLDPPDTEYLMIRVQMNCTVPNEYRPDLPSFGQAGPKPELPRDPYVYMVEAEQPYHVACLKAGRGLREGVSFEQISVPGPLGTRRFAKRSELERP